MDEISLDVPGYPPAKNEALSMLSAGHPHAPRVQLLLQAAQWACQHQGFIPISTGWVALDVVVRAPAHQEPWDGTNYLGGVVEVLEDKSSHGALDHLGALAGVWLYHNNRQIKRLTYRQVESDHATYRVTVRSMGRLLN